MNKIFVINELQKNKAVFLELLSGINSEVFLWRSNPDKWCLLEIVCHLYDEEVKDFKTRIGIALKNETKSIPPIDPEGWVNSREYLQKDYNEMLTKFIDERQQSINWLNSHINSNWNNYINHSDFGSLTANTLLENWLAHDYLHFRQITKLKFDYLNHLSGSLNYAGTW